MQENPEVSGRYVRGMDPEPDLIPDARLRGWTDRAAKAEKPSQVLSELSPDRITNDRLLPRLRPEEKSAVMKNVIAVLTNDQPANHAASTDWFRCLRLAHMLKADGTAIPAALDAKASKLYGDLMKRADDAWTKAKAAAAMIQNEVLRIPALGNAYKQRMSELLSLMSALWPEALQQDCGKRLLQTEADMSVDFDDRKIKTYITGSLAESRSIIRKIADDPEEREMGTGVIRKAAVTDKNLTEKDGVFTYKLTEGDRITEWNVFHRGGPNYGHCMVQQRGKPDVWAAVELDVFQQLAKDGKLAELMRQARWDAEHRNPQARGRLRAYDMRADALRGKKNSIAHIRVYDGTYAEPDNFNGALALAMRASALRLRYGKESVQVPVPVVSHTPGPDVAKTMRASYDGGSRHFCLDIITHGTPSGLQMLNPLKATDVCDAMLGLPTQDTTADVYTMACFAGNLREQFQTAFAQPKYAGLRKRINIFLDAKPYVGNSPMFAKEPDPAGGRKGLATFMMQREWSTHQYSLATLNLLNGQTFGAAHDSVEGQIGDYVPMDPEFLLEGELLTRNPENQAAGNA